MIPAIPNRKKREDKGGGILLRWTRDARRSWWSRLWSSPAGAAGLGISAAAPAIPDLKKRAEERGEKGGGLPLGGVGGAPTSAWSSFWSSPAATTSFGISAAGSAAALTREPSAARRAAVPLAAVAGLGLAGVAGLGVEAALCTAVGFGAAAGLWRSLNRERALAASKKASVADTRFGPRAPGAGSGPEAAGAATAPASAPAAPRALPMHALGAFGVVMAVLLNLFGLGPSRSAPAGVAFDSRGVGLTLATGAETRPDSLRLAVGAARGEIAWRGAPPAPLQDGPAADKASEPAAGPAQDPPKTDWAAVLREGKAEASIIDANRAWARLGGMFDRDFGNKSFFVHANLYQGAAASAAGLRAGALAPGAAGARAFNGRLRPFPGGARRYGSLGRSVSRAFASRAYGQLNLVTAPLSEGAAMTGAGDGTGDDVANALANGAFAQQIAGGNGLPSPVRLSPASAGAAGGGPGGGRPGSGGVPPSDPGVATSNDPAGGPPAQDGCVNGDPSSDCNPQRPVDCPNGYVVVGGSCSPAPPVPAHVNATPYQNEFMQASHLADKAGSLKKFSMLLIAAGGFMIVIGLGLIPNFLTHLKGMKMVIAGVAMIAMGIMMLMKARGKAAQAQKINDTVVQQSNGQDAQKQVMDACIANAVNKGQTIVAVKNNDCLKMGAPNMNTNIKQAVETERNASVRWEKNP